MRAQIVREAEQFINVAFAITDMNATLRLTEAFDRLPEILKPAKLSFFSMGTRVGLIFFLSAAVPLNFLRDQNFTAANPSGSPSVVTARLECISIPQTV